jgi:tripartite-type tricarboxylate transporter receptor subunit TctC
MFAPAGTPRDIVLRLNRALVRVIGTAQIRERLAALGVDAWPGTPEELRELLRIDIQRYGAIVRSAGLPRQ